MTSDPNPITVRTTRGAVELVATGDGPALLALHGAMGGWDQALLLARAIGPPGHRTIAPSRPGYLGTPLEVARSPEEQADLYAALLDALRIPDAAVMAVSGGGPSALHFARRHPGRCRALVLVSSVGEPMTERLPLRVHLTMWLGRYASVQAAIRRRIEADPLAAARRSIPDPDLRARTLADPDAGPLLRAMLATTADHLARRLDGTRQDLRTARAALPPLEELRVPTLVVHGTADAVVPFSRHGAALARRIPGAEILALEGAPHVALFTHRALVKPRVAAFLSLHAPAAPG